MRWNGGEGNPIGNPQSRGLPTWFVVPDQHARQILESGDFNLSDNKIKFARDFIEGRRAYFLTHCPTQWRANFKNLVLASYPTSELQTTLRDLEEGRPMFYCIHCDQQWKPTPDEAIRLKAELRKAWSTTLSPRPSDSKSIGRGSSVVRRSRGDVFVRLEWYLLKGLLFLLALIGALKVLRVELNGLF